MFLSFKTMEMDIFVKVDTFNLLIRVYLITNSLNVGISFE